PRPRLDVRLRDLVPPPLPVRERERAIRLRHPDPAENPAVGEGQRYRLEAGRDAPAALQDRLDDRAPRARAAAARQLGADPLAAVADPVTLQALGLLHVLEDLPPAPRVARPGQG